MSGPRLLALAAEKAPQAQAQVQWLWQWLWQGGGFPSPCDWSRNTRLLNALGHNRSKISVTLAQMGFLNTIFVCNIDCCTCQKIMRIARWRDWNLMKKSKNGLPQKRTYFPQHLLSQKDNLTILWQTVVAADIKLILRSDRGLDLGGAGTLKSKPLVKS